MIGEVVHIAVVAAGQDLYLPGCDRSPAFTLQSPVDESGPAVRLTRGTKWTTSIALALAVLGALAPSASAAPATREVLVVSNNWAGTADLIDPRTFERLKRIDVIPDRERRIAEINADEMAKFYFDNIRRPHSSAWPGPCRATQR